MFFFVCGNFQPQKWDTVSYKHWLQYNDIFLLVLSNLFGCLVCVIMILFSFFVWKAISFSIGKWNTYLYYKIEAIVCDVSSILCYLNYKFHSSGSLLMTVLSFSRLRFSIFISQLESNTLYNNGPIVLLHEWHSHSMFCIP